MQWPSVRSPSAAVAPNQAKPQSSQRAVGSRCSLDAPGSTPGGTSTAWPQVGRNPDALDEAEPAIDGEAIRGGPEDRHVVAHLGCLAHQCPGDGAPDPAPATVCASGDVVDAADAGGGHQ